MVQDVYVDLLFAIDFSMDFLCFYITSGILCVRLSPLRTVIASAIGAIYSVLSVVIDIGDIKIPTLVPDIAVCILICAIAFFSKKDGVKRLLFVTVIYVFVSSMLGGAMTAIFNVLNQGNMLEEGSIEGDGVNVWVFALAALASGVISLFGGRIFRKSRVTRRCTVRLTINGRDVTLKGLNDSGNLLKDPISGKPVIPIEIEKCVGMLPDKVRMAIRKNKIDLIDRLSLSEAKSIRLVPYKTAGGSSLLVSLIAEKVEILLPDGKERTVDALVAPIDMRESEIEALVPDELFD